MRNENILFNKTANMMKMCQTSLEQEMIQQQEAINTSYSKHVPDLI